MPETHEHLSNQVEHPHTHEDLNQLSENVRYDDARHERGSLRREVTRTYESREHQTSSEVLPTAENSEDHTETTEKPESKPTTRLGRAWEAITDAPTKVVEAFKTDPAKSTAKLAGGVGVGAAAWGFVGGGVGLLPVAVAVGGAAAGVWLAGKVIDKIRAYQNKE